jgi:hypothetical protein
VSRATRAVKYAAGIRTPDVNMHRTMHDLFRSRWSRRRIQPQAVTISIGPDGWTGALRQILIAQGTDPSICDPRPRKRKPSALDDIETNSENEEAMGVFW